MVSGSAPPPENQSNPVPPPTPKVSATPPRPPNTPPSPRRVSSLPRLPSGSHRRCVSAASASAPRTYISPSSTQPPTPSYPARHRLVTDTRRADPTDRFPRSLFLSGGPSYASTFLHSFRHRADFTIPQRRSTLAPYSPPPMNNRLLAAQTAAPAISRRPPHSALPRADPFRTLPMALSPKPYNPSSGNPSGLPKLPPPNSPPNSPRTLRRRWSSGSRRREW